MIRSAPPAGVASTTVPAVDSGPTTVTTEAIIADLRTAMGELKCLGSERLVRLGISMMQMHVMHLLDRHGELPMSRLADMLDVSVSAATGLIDRIEERGFVERIRVPSDRRVVLVRITPVGHQLLDDVEVLRSEIIEQVLDRLDPAQLAGVASALVDLRGALAATLIDDRSGLNHSHQAQGRD